jgi:hypothetical protein
MPLNPNLLILYWVVSSCKKPSPFPSLIVFGKQELKTKSCHGTLGHTWGKVIETKFKRGCCENFEGN